VREIKTLILYDISFAAITIFQERFKKIKRY